MGVDSEVLARTNKDALMVLKNYGVRFTHIKIDISNIHQHLEMLEAVQYINTHCAQAKQEIEITGKIVADHLKFAFNNVTCVTLTDLESPSKLSNMSDMFPQLQELTLNYMENIPWINPLHLPHMTKLVLHVRNIDTLSYVNLRSFIAQNPQIRSLITPANSYGYYSYYDELSTSLPQLEELTLTNDHMNTVRHGRKTHFPKVKSFTVSLGNGSCNSGASTIGKLPSLALDTVKSITVNAMNLTQKAPQANDELVVFIGQFKTVERVNTATVEWSYRQLKRLVGLLPNLEMLGMQWAQTSEIGEFVRFLKENNGLTRIRVSLISDDGWSVEELEEGLPKQWNVIERSAGVHGQQYPYLKLVRSE